MKLYNINGDPQGIMDLIVLESGNMSLIYSGLFKLLSKTNWCLDGIYINPEFLWVRRIDDIEIKNDMGIGKIDFAFSLITDCIDSKQVIHDFTYHRSIDKNETKVEFRHITGDNL